MPARASHFLQACDQDINQKFQQTIKLERDELLKMARCDARTANFKLIVGALGWRPIAGSDIVKAWEKVGLRPMDHRFVRKWENKNGSYPAPSKEAQSRQDDSAALREIEHATQSARSGEKSASRAIQQISIILKRQETASSALMSASPRSSSKPIGEGSWPAAPAKRVELPQSHAGCPAMFLAPSEQLDALRQSASRGEEERERTAEEGEGETQERARCCSRGEEEDRRREKSEERDLFFEKLKSILSIAFTRVACFLT